VHPALPPTLRALLQEHRGEFLFGHTAPDVQTVSGQRREATHFFALPFQFDAPPPWKRLLEQYPELAQAEKPVSQKIFLSGYLCHLQADWLWVRDIFAPVFGPFCLWSSFEHRLYLHNVLRAYLDRQVLPTLPADVGQVMQAARPAGWLPFASDHFLCRWRDELAGQLEPGATVRTVEFFAAQQKIEPARFYDLLQSESRMNQEIFGRLPRYRLDRYRQQLLDENLRLLQSYLWPSAAPLAAANTVSLVGSSVERFL